ncbi:MAG: HAMP domain-containing histidine kinase [Pirellulales bacterium]|nr:HAMP domain-containing histidine kinase [Pirellulales bacterium]
MRWPLRNQLLLPMVGVTLTAIIGVSVLNAYLSAQRAQERIEHELGEVAQTLAASAFPLTDAVLVQMKGLSGADYVLSDGAGEIVLHSSAPGRFPPRPPDIPEETSEGGLSGPIAIGDQSFFYTNVDIHRFSDRRPEPTTLHIYYPQQSYEEAWWDVVKPPLLVAAVAMVLVIAISLGVALRVTRPLVRLQRQVECISNGQFHEMPIPQRDDEVADLSRAVNRMAETLTQYEQEVRRHEQLRTLGQLGGGIAHQLRNAVTGCKLALDLHARKYLDQSDDESLGVARRQLVLMENYLQRFLALGKASSPRQETINLNSLVQSAVSLIRPTAEHLGVNLRRETSAYDLEVYGDREAIEQALVNVLLNGVEAAATPGHSVVGQSPSVNIALKSESDLARLTVSDNGPGPQAAVQETMFEPFVSEKADGVGLGLSVAQETLQTYGGSIEWSRRNGTTCFQIELPLTKGDSRR